MNRNGLSLVELVVVLAATCLLLAAVPATYDPSVEAARARTMKARGRGIWLAVVTANAEREPLDMPPVWPKEMGLSGTDSSTDYFRRLLSSSPDAPAPVETPMDRVASDLTLAMLAGVGVPPAASAASLAASNNAWCVTCVGNDSPPETAFLFLRNVDAGPVLSAASRVKPAGGPELNLNGRTVWITRGGACLDARFEMLTGALLCPTNCPPVTVMRP